MAEASLKLGGSWATKEDSLLGFNDENGNYKPIPFDFTRATTATRVNRDGLIEEVQAGVPRIDFSSDGSLLLEPQRTNLIPYSEYSGSGAMEGFGTGTYTQTITNNYTQSPDGFDNAIRFQATCGSTISDRSGLRDIISVSLSDTTLSFYMKSNTGSNQTLTFHFNGTNKSTIVATPEWQRFEYTDVSTSTLNACGFEIRGTITDTAVDVSVYGFQLEQADYATSYIPTSGSAVTRNADTSDGGESNNFDSSTAVWFIDLERTGIESGRAIYLADSSSVEQIRLHFDAPTEQIRFRDGKASFANIGGLISMGTSTRKKLALKIDGATLKVFADGSQIGSDYTRPTAFTIEKLIIADDAFKLYDIKFYQSALTDTELEELTTI